MNSGISVVLKATPLFSLWGFPITNSLLMTWLVMILLIGFALLLRRRLALVPGKLQAGIEAAFEFALDYMAEVLGTEEAARRFFPLVATIFLFVATANVLEFVPGVGESIGFASATGLTPLLRAPAADLNFTLALAAISFFVIEVTGIATLGLFRHLSRYVNLRGGPVGFAVGVIELLSNLGRLVSFSFRLFGNIFAGEVMVLVAGFFLPYVLPAPLMGFEMFIGLIQALVFAMLTLFFIKLAIMEPHGAH
ncbi:MAG: F0F1 ATP synthase subunit A [Patescibacteria group bacterium]|nr:F0F1 ATP synthase subunit A [Patescibacteria group bacterium]MDE1944422.1 F0F1 ATP synthase subunit A [Patescibacteria group bacterium]MDE1945107.1 F0F1 ATP synthase subunit A [Patescibacteria group bacterium]MDE2057617.1 F0F1 ATP synthase subunit A [Patescibacteria group bacterium]